MSLTIITPTTGSKYLQKCIESVKNQKNQNFTYYIVIDGSKFIDNTIKEDDITVLDSL